MGFALSDILAQRQGENFRLHAQYLSPQLPHVLETIGFDRFYVRGEGCYLYDADERRYLDLLAGYGVYALGRSHPTVMDALHQALDANLPNLVQLDCALLPGVLAEALVARAHPGIERVFFTNSGAEAIESAIKFARCATGRHRILYGDHAFHGLTTGALSLNGGAEFRKGFGDLLPGADPVPYGDIDALHKQLRKKNVAALVLEPIQGKGVNLAPDEFWPAAEELCRKYKTLLVIDEIQTGLGRTGRFFCHEHWGIQPDIITVSKALSGGYIPVGAMMCSAKVSDSVFSSMERAVVHSSTFSTNHLAMVAGLATLHAIDEEDIVDRARRTGELFMKSLAPLVERHEFLHEVRGKGLMIGLVFGPPTSRALRMRWHALEAIRTAFFSQLVVVPLFHRHRILTQVAADNVNVVKLLPPLIAGEEEVDYFVSALDDVLTSAASGSGLIVEFGKTLAKGSMRRLRP
ncbi:MAG: ornithine--oxo-acid transaminase [Pseudonocardiales bacterium]|nr:ornithine--oxo-acid transaminase [Pseudonocardiales bacterium]